MITPAQRAEIRRLFYGEHWKVGTIAAQLGLHRETVRTAVERETAGVRPSLCRPSILDPYLPFIRDTLAQYPRLRATRVHEMVRQRGYAGSVFPVRRLVRRLRPESGRAVYRRVVTLVGEQAQVDWGSFGKVRIGQGTRTVSGFVMVLGYSRALAALFTYDQTLESFLRGHVDAFEALGGAARNLVYDNLRSAVLDRRGTAVQFHPRLLELAGHYHFAPRPCTPGRGNEKGKIERQIQYLRHAFFAARPFRDLDDINAQFRRWRDEVAHRRRHPTSPTAASRRLGRREAPPAAAARPSLRDRPGARRPLRQDPLRPLRPQQLLDPAHARSKAADPGGRRHPHPHPRRANRADQPPPHLRHRTDRRGPGPSRKPARGHPPGQRPHHPATASAPPSPPPPRSSSASPNAERRCDRTPPGCSPCSTTTARRSWPPPSHSPSNATPSAPAPSPTSSKPDADSVDSNPAAAHVARPTRTARPRCPVP